MSLTFEYFVSKSFEEFIREKTVLEKMLQKNKAKNNAEEWASILKNKLAQIDELYNSLEMQDAINANANDSLYRYLTNIGYSECNKIDKVINEILSLEPYVAELEVINEVIEFASVCKTAEEFQKIWDLPEIPDDLDYRNPKNEYSQFMDKGTKSKINRCLKIKNANPIYAICYIMVPNHYDMEVGLLDFSDETKEKVDEIIKKAGKYLSADFNEILVNN